MHISAQAIAGAAGVVAGAVITGGFQSAGAFFTNRRKTRQARRMIRTELDDLRNQTIGALMHETRVEEVLPFKTPRWEAYAPQLAEFFFREAKFETLENAYDEFRRFSDASLARVRGGYGGTRDGWIKHGLQTLEKINTARRTLGVDAPKNEVVVPPAHAGGNERPDGAPSHRDRRGGADGPREHA